MQLQSFLSHEGILSVIDGMAQKTRALAEQRNLENLAIIGIRTGGVLVAEALHKKLGVDDPLGTLDIAFYRDDFSQIGLNPEVKPSQISFDIDGRHILLVDDVIHTGRTIRAALNEIFDYGRPASVTLAALVDRVGSEVAVHGVFVGGVVTLTSSDLIILTGEDDMELVIGSRQ